MDAQIQTAGNVMERRTKREGIMNLVKLGESSL